MSGVICISLCNMVINVSLCIFSVKIRSCVVFEVELERKGNWFIRLDL